MSYSTAIPAELVGVDPVTLQSWLTAAQTARHQLRIGGKVAEVSYAQSDGNKMVRYTAAKVGDLDGYILQLQRALGNIGPRRAMGVRFA
jgi:hypothetical protein